MRIVNLAIFLTMPVGTVFAKYRPQVFGDLMLKGETYDGGDVHPGDFQYQNLTDEVFCDDSIDRLDLLFKAEEHDVDFNLDFECWSRDGCFDPSQLFAVWSSKDVNDLIKALRKYYPTED